MQSAIFWEMVGLMAVGSVFLMVFALRGKLRPGLGRSWRIQQVTSAVEVFFCAIITACAGLVLGKGLIATAIWFVLDFSLVMACIGFAFMIFIVTVRLPGAVEALHVPSWAYRWLFDEHDARRSV